MKKILFPFTMLLLLAQVTVLAEPLKLDLAGAKAPKSKYDIKRLMDKIKENDMRSFLTDFVDATTPNRVPGELGSKKARTYIKDYLSKLANDKIHFYHQTFTPQIEIAKQMYLSDFENEVAKKYKPHDPVFLKWKQFTEHVLGVLDQFREVPGENFFLHIKGKNSEKTIYLLANYDTILKDENDRPKIGGKMSGADDNASGVIGALTMAQFLATLEPQHDVVIAIFDYQEMGFLGARYFLENREDPTVKAMPAPTQFISLLMLGNDSSHFDKEKKKGNMKVYHRANNSQDMLVWNEMKEAGEAAVAGTLFTVLPNDFNMGDHFVFWEKSIPGLVFTQDWENDLNPRQHTNDDIPESLNYATMAKTIRYILAPLIGI